MRIALLQTNASDDPARNLAATHDMIVEAAEGGATFVLTPEVTNCVSANRTRQTSVLRPEEKDATLSALAAAAEEYGIWLLIGSLALQSGDPDGRFANRSFLIGPDGMVRARYDKIHMFDVDVSPEETYRESAGYRPGSEAILARTEIGTIGMTICYDVRFPHLYRSLAQQGAEILTVPAAFSPGTGPMHWEPLLRARAIETGSFVLAPAQTGTHSATSGRERRTHGHSLVVSPWGEVLLDAGTEPGVHFAEIDLAAVSEARRKVPSVLSDAVFDVRVMGEPT
ncbi:carbon-nitrogen hydrolase family protein [Roseicyclus sp. F158]|uniref:Carbon-nitrogen hydrolase family protein n=1 Tax=Tropicimonas omnivorans TaxID=3075590 RepID=A0ABU3DCS2_9RHOB|nr:carbon-nitrogen hydrolase family protein [Roseicyclus sp. F158]MDT0681517.1 carbon-nitrogen hydrolase family protein [Roseicyclus sp. F158]